MIRLRALSVLVLFAFVASASAQDDSSFIDRLFSGDPDRNRSAERMADEAPSGSATPSEVPQSPQQIQLSFAPVVRSAAPAVVNVYATKEIRRESSPLFGDPFFEQFFGRSPRSQQRNQSSLGSGVIIGQDGLVVTNHHVIANADAVRIALADGREMECEVVLSDETVDLAVLRITTDAELPVLPFGDSDALEVGDLVLAIGNPFGVGQTTTSGIISALARNHVGVSDFGFFVQTDAAINPGNSGGALVDMQGRLIGINTAIFSRSGGSNGIGFAIPANMVRAVVAAAERGEDRFERPWLGAAFAPVTNDIAEALGFDRPRGVLIADIVEDSPAQQAKLRVGDVITRMDGRTIEHVDALGYRIATHPIGDAAVFTIVRDGEEIDVSVDLSRAPDDSLFMRELDGSHPLQGAVVAALNSPLAQRLGVAGQGDGALIVEVPRRSVAARYGFAPGDIVRKLNGATITDDEVLERYASDDARVWQIVIERDGRLIQRVFNF